MRAAPSPGPLFTATWAVEGATRANYDPLRHPVSSLELGDAGWTQQANFVVAGLLTLAFAIGLRRALRPLGGSTWGPLLAVTTLAYWLRRRRRSFTTRVRG